MSQATRETVKTVEAAEILEVSTVTILRLIDTGELEAYKLTPGKTSPYRIYRDSIDAFISRRQQRPSN